MYNNTCTESAHAPQQTYTCTVHTQLHVCSMWLLCTAGAALIWSYRYSLWTGKCTFVEDLNNAAELRVQDHSPMMQSLQSLKKGSSSNDPTLKSLYVNNVNDAL